MRHAGRTLLAALMMCAVWTALEAAEETVTRDAVEPRTGEVTSHDINVRAGAHLNYEVLTQLDKGDLVLILGRRDSWTRIAMPPGVLAWVSTELVADDGLVEADRVNVRSGPGEEHIVLCQLARDQQVLIKEKSADGNWYGIAPPDGTGAWIATKYVADKGPASLYAEWAPRKAKCLALLESADRLRNDELKRPEADIRFNAILANYRQIETDYADMPQARTAKYRAREIERIQKDVEARLAASGKTTQPETTPSTENTTSTNTTTPETSNTNTAATDEQEPEAKYLTAKGVLREISRESTDKGLYRLAREDRWICIVKSTSLDLGPYLGKSIQVWGHEVPSEGWSLRTIEAARVRMLE